MKDCNTLPSIEYCTGCQACRVACPVNAIHMEENEKGDIYPVVDEDTCIKCNKCLRTCPELSKISSSPKPDNVCAIWVNSSKSRRNSTSGGASYILAKKIIERGGVFYGVIYNNGGAEHQRCSDIKNLPHFQGSKYTHSDVRTVYKEIEQLLKEGKEILFSGTPCQVAGLRSFLHKDYERLYCIDIVCHGVPSKIILRDRIKYIESQHGKKIANVRFRHKQPDQYNTGMKYTFSDGTSYFCSEFQDPYIRAFEKGLVIRQNCFNCQYKKAERVSDITIADFWGYKPRKFKYHSYRKGTSLMLVNTQKGISLFNLIKEFCVIDNTRTFAEATRCNENLLHPQNRPVDYDEFWNRYLGGETLEALQIKFYPCVRPNKISWINKVKQLIKLTLSTLGIYKIK